MAKFIKANEVPKLIKDGADVLLDGFVTIGVPEEIYYEIEKSFLETGSPKDLRNDKKSNRRTLGISSRIRKFS